MIGSGKPVAVMFATPARCQSLYCGPVLDELLDVDGALPGPRHLRARRDLQGTDAARTRADGRRVGHRDRAVALHDRRRRHDQGRLDGAIGKQEIIDQLDALGRHSPGRERAHRLRGGPEPDGERSGS